MSEQCRVTIEIRPRNDECDCGNASVSAAHSSQLLPPPPLCLLIASFQQAISSSSAASASASLSLPLTVCGPLQGKRPLLFQQQALLVSPLPSVIINCSAISADAEAEAEAEVVCVHFCHRVRLHFARLARHFGIVGVLFSVALVPCRDSARVILICSCCSVLGFC